MNNYSKQLPLTTTNNSVSTANFLPSKAVLGDETHQASVFGGDEKTLALDACLSGYTDVFEGWNSKSTREILSDAWVDYALNFAEWKSFITLTFREEKFPDVAMSLFKWWVKSNNEHAFGKRYNRVVGYSYFSYLVGMEYQSREVVHFHVLVDKPINYGLTHLLWGERCGFAWVDGNLKSSQKVVDYVCKYVMKGGQIDLYKAKKDYCPKVVPTWWLDEKLAQSRVAQGASQRPGQLAKPLTGCPDQLSALEYLARK